MVDIDTGDDEAVSQLIRCISAGNNDEVFNSWQRQFIVSKRN